MMKRMCNGVQVNRLKVIGNYMRHFPGKQWQTKMASLLVALTIMVESGAETGSLSLSPDKGEDLGLLKVLLTDAPSDKWSSEDFRALGVRRDRFAQATVQSLSKGH